MNDIGDWIQKLLSDLKITSTGNWGSDHRPMPAMPAKIEGAIIKASDGIDLKLRRVYYEQAISDFEKLIKEGDPYTETLRRTSARLSELLKRMPPLNKAKPDNG